MRPKIYREIFANDGEGPLIRDDILPASAGDVTSAQLQAVINRVTVNETSITNLQGEAAAKWVILNNVQAYQLGTVAPFIVTTNTRLDALEAVAAQVAALTDRVAALEALLGDVDAALDVIIGESI